MVNAKDGQDRGLQSARNTSIRNEFMPHVPMNIIFIFGLDR